MSVQSKKLELIEWLTQIQDDAVLDMLLVLKEEKEKDWWSSLTHEQREDIQAGINDLEAGDKKDFFEVVKGL